MPQSAYNLPVPPLDGFKVIINNNDKYTNDRLVSLSLNRGDDVTKMAISNRSDLSSGTGQIDYQDNYQWDLCCNSANSNNSCNPGIYIVYVRFFTKYGQGSDIISDSIAILPQNNPNDSLQIESLKAKLKDILTAILDLQDKIEQLISEQQTAQVKVKDTQFQETIPSNYIFKYRLEYGEAGIHVKYLQIFLKSQGREIYPEGIISGWFGPLVKQAVIRFQEKYHEDILAPWGFSQGTGTVAVTTNKKINEILKRY